MTTNATPLWRVVGDQLLDASFVDLGGRAVHRGEDDDQHLAVLEAGERVGLAVDARQREVRRRRPDRQRRRDARRAATNTTSMRTVPRGETPDARRAKEATARRHVVTRHHQSQLRSFFQLPSTSRHAAAAHRPGRPPARSGSARCRRSLGRFEDLRPRRIAFAENDGVAAAGASPCSACS